MVSQQELADVFSEFVDSMGLWNELKEFVEDKGYTLTELQLGDDDES